MDIESEVSKGMKLKENRLIPFGFKKVENQYRYSKEFMNGSFRADIGIDAAGNLHGKVIDLEMNDEYTNFRIETITGEFVNTVKNGYIEILQDIVNYCFEKQYFIFEQANRIARLINEKYQLIPEFLWEKFPHDGVFRNTRSNKWFGIIMNIDKSKLIPTETGEIDVLNIKLDEEVGQCLEMKGIYPAYHLSKKSWVSIILDDTLSDEEVMKLVDKSYNSSNIQGEWIVPANPKYYDVITAFQKADIISWKQSNHIMVGDTIYLYVAEPYSAILYKCEAIETDIPYQYSDKNLSMKKVMKIKLLKQYDKTQFTFRKLNEYGIKAIRGPRRISKELSEELKGEKELI